MRVRSAALARLVALEVIPQLERVQLPAGTCIQKADGQWLIIVESDGCATRATATHADVPMPAGSALCRLAVPADGKGGLSPGDEWDTLQCTGDGVLGVIHVSALQSVMQTAREQRAPQTCTVSTESHLELPLLDPSLWSAMSVHTAAGWMAARPPSPTSLSRRYGSSQVQCPGPR